MGSLCPPLTQCDPGHPTVLQLHQQCPQRSPEHCLVLPKPQTNPPKEEKTGTRDLGYRRAGPGFSSRLSHPSGWAGRRPALSHTEIKVPVARETGPQLGAGVQQLPGLWPVSNLGTAEGEAQ